MFFHRFFGRLISLMLLLVLVFAGGNLLFRGAWAQGYAAGQGEMTAPAPVIVDLQNWVPTVLVIAGVILVLSIASAVARYYFWKKMGGPEMFAKFRQAKFYGYGPMHHPFHRFHYGCPYAWGEAKDEPPPESEV